ncbi:hypothetical protein P7C71_g3664, partial [Lecanoromycetidae sp. Uapishka_2]
MSQRPPPPSPYANQNPPASRSQNPPPPSPYAHENPSAGGSGSAQQAPDPSRRAATGVDVTYRTGLWGDSPRQPADNADPQKLREAVDMRVEATVAKRDFDQRQREKAAAAAMNRAGGSSGGSGKQK